MPQKYRIASAALEHLQPEKRRIFLSEASPRARITSPQILVQDRGYKVNQDIADSTGGVQAISFFSGAGGLDLGAHLAGVRVLSSLDFDKDCVATMRANSVFSAADNHLGDIREVGGKDYKKVLNAGRPDKLILIGGPPCQPFSKAGYWVTHDNRLGSKDPRNMISEYLRLIRELGPDGFLLENVESLIHPKNLSQVRELEEAIDRLGYHFIRYHADATRFGIPQKRKRIFFIASKRKFQGGPRPTHGESGIDLVACGLLPPERVVDWIWKFDSDLYAEPEEIALGKTYGFELCEIPPGENYFALTAREGYPTPKFEANKRFWSFLLKLHPLRPSWTISAQPGPWVGPFHWNNRRLRVPEIAAIQTFPEDYVFNGSRRSVQKQIGNAVPPLLGKAMTEFLLDTL